MSAGIGRRARRLEAGAARCQAGEALCAKFGTRANTGDYVAARHCGNLKLQSGRGHLTHMNKQRLVLLLACLAFSASGLCAPDEQISLTLRVANAQVTLGENPRPVLLVRNVSTSSISACETAIGVVQVVLRRDGFKVAGERGEVRSFDPIAETVRRRQRQLAPDETMEISIPTIGGPQAVGLQETQPMNSDGSGTAGLMWTRWIERPGTYDLTIYYRKDLSSAWTPSNSVSFEVTP